jgi:cytochrome c oxidase cbb3-type subunit 3
MAEENVLTGFWSLWVWIISVGLILSFLYLLHFAKTIKGSDSPDRKMHHTFDGIEEYDNPMPKWWLWLFYGTIFWGLGYLAVYPMGNSMGISGITNLTRLEADQQAHQEKYGPIFEKYASVPVEELSNDEDAVKIGRRLFLNNCAVCHGQDARGGYGFPNLTDNDWLYGGSGDTIKTTIMSGRNGAMPAWGDSLGEEGVNDVAHYVLSLSGRDEVDAEAAARGKELYSNCAACHGQDGKGNELFGAPNLTDNIWLYGGTLQRVKHTIRNGRNGVMPAHEDLLGEQKVHILSAYIYSLSNK